MERRRGWIATDADAGRGMKETVNWHLRLSLPNSYGRQRIYSLTESHSEDI